MNCTVCQHPQRQEIDQALITGSATLEALSQNYGLSTSALQRHKAHLRLKVDRARNQLQDNLRQGCLFWLSQALEMCMQTAQDAQTEGNSRILLQAIRQGTRLITIILKQDFQLDDRIVFEMLSSPEWATQDSLLPHNPQVLIAGRRALTRTLSSPCSAIDSASPEDVDLESLQAMFSNLVQPPVTQPNRANRQAAKINRRLKKRQKGGKLPGKTAPQQDIHEDNQIVISYQKNPAKNSFFPTKGGLLEELAAGRLDIETLHAIGAGRPIESLTALPLVNKLTL
jgi:hypothetical protein